MQSKMPNPNSKKRPAPGSSPVYSQPQMQQFSSNAPTQLSNADFLRYSQGPENSSFADRPVKYDMDSYEGTALLQAPLGQALPGQSTQLARSPHSRQLVHSGQQPSYDMATTQWDGLVNSQDSNDVMEENDNIELLEKRAVEVKKEAKNAPGWRKQIPPFIHKLSSFLDESKNTDLIRWSDKGDSFIVLDEDEFARTLIPELFKHNNYASFVRQLNMYGFHKRVGVSDNSMRAERKNKSPSEYYNPYFKRGRPNLLWLINKPSKGVSGKRAKKGGKNGETQGDSNDETMDGVEETFGSNYNNNMQGNSRALSAAPQSRQFLKQEMALVQSQLAQVQRQQKMIINTIQQIQKQHKQLYDTAHRFQGYHERHDNSVNAILTFLATVYNRSLDGQNLQNINFTQLFSNGNLQDMQHQQNGNVVDMGDVGNQQRPTPVSPNRRAQRLLMAPPTGRAQTLTPGATTPQETTYAMQNQVRMPRSGTVEEVFDANSPADTSSPNIQGKPDSNEPIDAQQDMINLIHYTNAQSRASPATTASMGFPGVLSHYEDANGHSPLSTEQRNNILSLMSGSFGGTNNNNALTNPTSPAPPDFAPHLDYTGAELDEWIGLQNENEGHVEDMATRLNSTNMPYSPTTQGYAGSDGGAGNIDLDQLLDAGAYYNPNDSLGLDGANTGLDGYDDLGDTGMGFDLGLDGADGNDLTRDGVDGITFFSTGSPPPQPFLHHLA